MALPMRLTPEDLGLLVGGIVRQFVPDFVPAGFEEAQVVAEAGRMARIIPKKMHGELLPFALECASESLDLKQIGPSLVHTANRAGLLACGAARAGADGGAPAGRRGAAARAPALHRVRRAGRAAPPARHRHRLTGGDSSAPWPAEMRTSDPSRR